MTPTPVRARSGAVSPSRSRRFDDDGTAVVVRFPTAVNHPLRLARTANR